MAYSVPETRARLSSAGTRCVVAVLTYRRTEGLARTLDTLITACRGLPNASVLVVDNNPGGDARPIALAVAAGPPRGRLRYVHEPRPGIAAARNRAIGESSDADVLVFVDDDERPTPGWLEQLLRLHGERGPAAVAGPVVSEFARLPERWILDGRFFTRRRLPTGTRIACAATNNLLIDLVQLRALGIEFADEFGLTGGSDTLFTRQIVQRGATILWCDEAVVIDDVPAGRLTRQWVLQKAFRQGNVAPRVDLALAATSLGRLRVRLAGVAGGAARMAAGGAAIVAGAVTANVGRRARGTRRAVRGAGMVLGSCGYAYVEYARTHGADVPRSAPEPIGRPSVEAGDA
jgi:hypothetical protein